MLVVVVVTVLLGLWQLRRHDEVSTRNAVLAERLDADPRPLDTGAVGDVEGVEQVRIVANGTWDLDHEVVLRNRSRRGVNGNLVLTPLVLADGSQLLVARGWVPPDRDDPPIADARPVDAPVEVIARLQAPEPQPGFGAKDVATQTPTDQRAFFNADVGLISAHLGIDLLAPWAILEASTPAQPDQVLRPLEPIELGDGPHLEYAFQWFGIGFAAIASWSAWVVRGRRRGAASHVGADRES